MFNRKKPDPQGVIDTGLTWKNRALVAEAELATVKPALETATEHLAGIEMRFNERAALVSITKAGRINKFIFLRNGQLFTIETMGTWDDDVEGWKKALLEPLPPAAPKEG